MSNLGKNGLWKTIGKHESLSRSNSNSNFSHSKVQQRQLNSIRIINPSKDIEVRLIQPDTLHLRHHTSNRNKEQTDESMQIIESSSVIEQEIDFPITIKCSQSSPVSIEKKMRKKYNELISEVKQYPSWTQHEVSSHIESQVIESQVIDVQNHLGISSKMNQLKLISIRRSNGQVMQLNSPQRSFNEKEIFQKIHIKSKAEDELSFNMEKRKELQEKIKAMQNSQYNQSHPETSPSKTINFNNPNLKHNHQHYDTQNIHYLPKIRIIQGIASSQEDSSIQSQNYSIEEVEEIVEITDLPIQAASSPVGFFYARDFKACQKQFFIKQNEFILEQQQLSINQESQLHFLEAKKNQKDQLLSNIKLKFKKLSKQFNGLKRFQDQMHQMISEILSSFRQKQITKLQKQINQKVALFHINSKDIILSNQSLKSKQVLVELQEQRKKLIEKEDNIRVYETQNIMLQKQVRDLQLNLKSSKSQVESLGEKVKKLQDEKSQMKQQFQDMEYRSKKIKEQLDKLSQNTFLKSPRGKESQEELESKINRLKMQLQDKQQQLISLRQNYNKFKVQQQSQLLRYRSDIRQTEKQMIQYKKNTEKEIQKLTDQLKQERIHHEKAKISIQQIKLKIKEKQLEHQKEIQKYEKTLNQIEKDLESLSLKKNRKDQNLNKKENQLLKRQNELSSQKDRLRQQRNQLECAIELYNQNIIFLQRKQRILNSKYLKAVETQNITKDVWNEKYHRFSSPINLKNPFNQKKSEKIATNKIKSVQKSSDSRKSPGSPKLPRTDEIVKGMRRAAIKQRIEEISNSKSNKILRKLSPSSFKKQIQIKSKLLSHQALNLIHKAKSVEGEKRIVQSPLRERPERIYRDKSPTTRLSITKPLSLKTTQNNSLRQIEVVKAKLQQIKSSIHNEIMAGRRGY